MLCLTTYLNTWFEICCIWTSLGHQKWCLIWGILHGNISSQRLAKWSPKSVVKGWPKVGKSTPKSQKKSWQEVWQMVGNKPWPTFGNVETDVALTSPTLGRRTNRRWANVGPTLALTLAWLIHAIIVNSPNVIIIGVHDVSMAVISQKVSIHACGTEDST